MPKIDDFVRNPYDSELEYFKSNPTVSGMATEDNKIILNPYTKLSKKEKDAVTLNEYSRILMRTNPQLAPNFALSNEQIKFLDSNAYKNASEQDKMATIAARLLSNDPSAGTPTIDQLKFVNKLKDFINKDM